MLTTFGRMNNEELGHFRDERKYSYEEYIP